MTVFRFPSSIPNSSVWTAESNTAAFVSPFTGAIQTQDRGGERWRPRLTFRNLQSGQRERLQAFFGQLNGQQNRVLLTDDSYTMRGSIAGAGELVDVLPFNATNYRTAFASRGEVVDIDEGIRHRTLTDLNASSIHPTNLQDGIAGQVAGRLYCATCFHSNRLLSPFGGSLPRASIQIRETLNGVPIANPGGIAEQRRLKIAALCFDVTKFFINVQGNTDGVALPNAIQDFADLSVARCLMIDNDVNTLLHSEDAANAVWTNLGLSAVNSNTEVAPDGTTTADDIIENSATGSHTLLQSSIPKPAVSEYWTFSRFIKPKGRNFCALHFDVGSANGVTARFQLTGAGTLGTITLTGNFSNPHSDIQAYPNGWYRCRVTARTDAILDVRAFTYCIDSLEGVLGYLGDGVSGLTIWGANIAKGFAAGRYTKTTTTAAAGTSQAGTIINVKGGDPNLNNLLRGDMVEIGDHVHMLTEDFRTDESGNGSINVWPRVRVAPANEDPVILHRPHGIFLLANPANSWSNRPGVFSDFSIDFIEDITA